MITQRLSEVEFLLPLHPHSRPHRFCPALTGPLPPPGPLQLVAHQLLQWIFPNTNANGATSLLDTSSLSPAPQGRVNVLGTMGKAGPGKAMEED